MSNEFKLAMERQGLTSVAPLVHRNYLEELPALREVLAKGGAAPWVGPAVAELTQRLPVMSCLPSMDEASPFARPPRHARCFYYSQGGIRGTGGVLALKGTEPMAPDFEMMLQVLETLTTPEIGGSHQRNLAEHFALVEHKVPGALALQEAESESAIAAQIQLRHYEAYGTPAHLPLPLLVMKLPDSTEGELRAALKQRLSSRAFARLGDVLAKGLGVYIYYYPALPIRVSHLSGALPSSLPTRIEALEQRLKVTAVIDGWVQQFVRLIHLGYLPVALGSRGTGACCDSNNSVIDGGFVDVDSLIHVSELEQSGKPGLLEETLHLSTRVLWGTVRTLLAPPRSGFEIQQSIDLPSHLVAQYVTSRIRHFLKSEALPQLQLDPKITAYFESDLSFTSMIERMKGYYPPFDLEALFSSKDIGGLVKQQ